MRLTLFLTSPVLLLILATTSCAKSPSSLSSLNKGPKQVTIGQQIITIEVANTNKERARGLMFRKFMAEDRGMLFTYPIDTKAPFWMKNTLIPLDIAFIDNQGTIVGLDTMTPLTLTPHGPDKLYRFALELNAGFFAKYDVKIGDKVLAISNK